MEREWAPGQRAGRGPVQPSADDSRRGVAGVPTILVVDDEEAIRDFLRSALEAEGYTVLAAADGMEALSLCEYHWVDVILLDLMMPRLDGLGFLHRFRRRSGRDVVSIYIMSAVRSAVEQVATAGVSGAFVKPFDLDELLETIADELQRRRQAIAIRETAAPLKRAGPA